MSNVKSCLQLRVCAITQTSKEIYMIRFLVMMMVISFSAGAADWRETLKQRGNFSTFIDLVDQMGLASSLSKANNLTLFVPTDQAFADAEVSSDQLLDVLQYHMAKPVLTKKILRVLNGVKTLSGYYITKFSLDSGFQLGNAEVVEFNITNDNGVIHIIDSVLEKNDSTSKNEIQPVSYVDIDKYMGLWYEVYRYPNRFERGCGNVTAEYALKHNGSVSVINTCERSSGKVKKAHGTALVVNKNTNSELKVSFVPWLQRYGIFGGDYNILYLEENYQYVMVGSKDRNFLWFLARTETLNPEDLSLLRLQAISQGYDPERLIETPRF